MPAMAKFPATPGQFVKDNTTDLVNLFLGWAVFWCYGFRLVLWCGYSPTQSVSKWYCDRFLDDVAEAIPDCFAGSSPAESPDLFPAACDEWDTIPRFAEIYSRDLYETCTGRDGERFDNFGSLNTRGGFCSGVYGSGEFVVTLMLMILVTVVFFWKMVKFVQCPDKLERKRRTEVMLKDFLLSQKSQMQ